MALTSLRSPFPPPPEAPILTAAPHLHSALGSRSQRLRDTTETWAQPGTKALSSIGFGRLPSSFSMGKTKERQ